ncbi:MAG TPA: FtsX-like permease family protein [Mycobacteriales bacterium]|jgi:putative ABC transport system permease protein|nr:FtsX-like permease family protein [Mycobacteriales bacterium]
MYPELTVPLVGILLAVLALLAWPALRWPVVRRLAVRQVARRRAEGLLVMAGASLGAAIIVGSLVVGDTLGFSVRQVAYRTLGNVDERVVSTDGQAGAIVAGRLQPLTGSPDVDGVLTARVQQVAATANTAKGVIAEPRVLAWDVDFSTAYAFGGVAAPSGLSGPPPRAGQVVVNRPLADALSLRAGSPLTVYVSGVQQQVRVARVIPESGLAGTGFGATQNRNLFLPPGALARADSSVDGTRWVTFVSNRGGVQSGDELTAQVSRQIRAALGVVSPRTLVETPKHDVLRSAKKTGDSLGALFLMIGSFSIIAGALLLMNIFVMLGEERKSQLGMLRAAGLKRSHLVAAFSLEGAVYAAAAAFLGIGLGVALGRGVAYVAARIFGTWSQDGSGLDVTFSVSATSIINGVALGLLIALLTVIATSLRISRFNIIAAIRDLPSTGAQRSKRRNVVVSTSLAVLFLAMAVPSVATSNPNGTFLFPALALLCAAPLLSGVIGRRWAYSALAFAVLVWTLLVNLVRPGVYDTPSMSLYVVMGTLLALSAVLVVSENQSIVLRPVHRLLGRSTEGALSTRLALAYPVAKRFRTGATLVMYTLVFLVLVLISQIGAVLAHSVDSQVASSTSRYDVRLDFRPSDRMLGSLRNGALADQITRVTPMTSARAAAIDPGHRTTELIETLAVGVPAGSVSRMQFQKRLAPYTTDAQVWRALARDSRYVVLDAFFGATGGPPGEWYVPGDEFVLIDPLSGRRETKTIVGVLRNSTIFYSPITPTALPVVMNETAVQSFFRGRALVSSALVSARPGVAPATLAARLQGSYLSSSLVATPVAATIRRMFDANVAFFRLMDGFLALGLLIGICGLGVVMVRAVRERRRTIGVLRALGFRTSTVQRSFLIESGFVAFEGVVLGGILGIVTTWLMYQRSAMFADLQTGFPVLWGTVTVLGLVTIVMSLVATVGPARRAAHILPALATRVTD